MAATITVFPQDSTQIKVLSTIMKALNIKFAVAKTKEKPYDPAFVAKILKSKTDYKVGKGTSMTIEQLEDLCK